VSYPGTEQFCHYYYTNDCAVILSYYTNDFAVILSYYTNDCAVILSYYTNDYAVILSYYTNDCAVIPLVNLKFTSSSPTPKCRAICSFVDGRDSSFCHFFPNSVSLW
jgi:hypothetical protein